jgi:hypothetical protein
MADPWSARLKVAAAPGKWLKKAAGSARERDVYAART